MTDSDRPVRLRIMQWFWFTSDRFMDKHEWSQAERWDWAWSTYDFVQGKAARVLCRIYDHQPERDQCGLPEHDFCLFCHKSVPHGYDSKFKGGTEATPVCPKCNFPHKEDVSRYPESWRRKIADNHRGEVVEGSGVKIRPWTKEEKTALDGDVSI